MPRALHISSQWGSSGHVIGLDVSAGAQQKQKPKKNWNILYKVSYREIKEKESEHIKICGDKQEALEGH